MKASLAVLSVIFIAVGFFGCDRTLPSVETLVSEFTQTQEADARQKILEQLLETNTAASNLAFWELFWQVPDQSTEIFANAIIKSGDCMIFWALVDFKQKRWQRKTGAIMENENIPMADRRKIMEIEKATSSAYDPFTEKIKRLGKSLSFPASRCKDSLIAQIHGYGLQIKAAREGTISSDEIEFPHEAVTGMKFAGEMGFEELLKQSQTDEKTVAIAFVLEDLGPEAVRPLCWIIEDPKSTENQVRRALFLLHELPFNDETMDKLAEAYTHGSYLRSSRNYRPKHNLENRWWLYFPRIYEKEGRNEDFLRYLGQRCLGRDSGAVFQLMSEIDFQKAFSYIRKVNPARIPKSSLERMLTSLSTPRENERSGITDMRMGSLIFFLNRLPMEKRREYNLSLVKYSRNLPPTNHAAFIINGFENNLFTATERLDGINEMAIFTPEIKQQVWKDIEPYCTNEEKQIIR